MSFIPPHSYARRPQKIARLVQRGVPKGESEAESDADDKDQNERAEDGNQIGTEDRPSPKKSVVSHSLIIEGTNPNFFQDTHNVQFGALWKEVKSD